MKSQSKKRVFVAMSGGVDSSVAAALLQKQGYEVTGVFMRPWSPNSEITDSGLRIKGQQSVMRNSQLDNCLWKRDREDAMRAASVLGIPLLTWDFSKEYKKEVGDYMIREYKGGRTPNPDVMCNKEIKFGLFFKKALREGADFIATGHYVCLRRTSKKLKVPKVHKGQKLYKHYELYKLLTAVDKNKDQSYFLWTLKQEQLRYCLFPIGDYLKPEVRKLAKEFGLSNHDKKDSQGVCFIGPLDMKNFLSKYIKNKVGKIINTDGLIVGEHDGVYYYTIGQRHGLNIGDGGGPYYVIKKDLKKNIIHVGKEGDLRGLKTKVTDLSWLNNKITFPAKIDVKIRYRSKSEKAILSKDGTLKFIRPIRAITSGQSAVFYRKNELLGGGIIK
ncbi:MAG: tRNA 2-thiouridine(34) synthase MnmA [Candidatus Yanofskybacteria bacterium]|nr:tRNA 2-thiouridine(34) synthase MnmA [Candidatus Yanofskybacteria bacterium]